MASNKNYVTFDLTTGKWVRTNTANDDVAFLSLAVGGASGPVITAESGAFSFGDVVLTHVASPVVDTDVANKAYVDAVAQGLLPKQPCATGSIASEWATVTVTSGSGTVGSPLLLASMPSGSGFPILDGVQLALNTRVLIKSFLSGDRIYNGLYYVSEAVDDTSAKFVRTTDADNQPVGGEVRGGLFTFVTGGTTLADTGWVISYPDGPVDLLTDPIEFAQFSAAGIILPGAGLTQLGNVFSVDTSASGGLDFHGTGDSAKLAVKVEASNPTLEVNGSNELAVNTSASGGLTAYTDGLAVFANADETIVVDASGVKFGNKLGANLNVGTYSITTAEVDGNVKLEPNGTGKVEIDGSGIITTPSANDLTLDPYTNKVVVNHTITTPAATDLTLDPTGVVRLGADLNVNGLNIVSDPSQDIIIYPGGAGDTASLRVGDTKGRIYTGGNFLELEGVVGVAPKGELKLVDSSGSFFTILKTNDSGGATLTLPIDTGSSLQTLTTDGNGIMYWHTVDTSMSLAGLTDVTLTSAASNNILQHNGAAWVNKPNLVIDHVSATDKGIDVTMTGGAAALAITQNGIGDGVTIQNNNNQNAVVITSPSGGANLALSNGTNYVAFFPSSASDASNWNFMYPKNVGSAGQVLTTDGTAGVMTWETISTSLSGLSDVSIASATSNDHLYFNGTAWANVNPVSSAGTLEVSAGQMAVRFDKDFTNAEGAAVAAGQVVFEGTLGQVQLANCRDTLGKGTLVGMVRTGGSNGASIPVVVRPGADVTTSTTTVSSTFSFAYTDVDTTGDLINKAGHGMSGGEKIVFTNPGGGSLPGGITANTVYYVIATSASEFQIETTLSGGAIDLTAQGTGTHWAVRQGGGSLVVDEAVYVSKIDGEVLQTIDSYSTGDNVYTLGKATATTSFIYQPDHVIQL